jgi:hypothetical protein
MVLYYVVIIPNLARRSRTQKSFKKVILHSFSLCTNAHLHPQTLYWLIFNVLQLNDLFFNGLIHKIVNHFDFDEYSYKKWLFTNKFVGEFMSLLYGTFLYKKIVCHSTCIITLKMNMKYKVMHACRMGYTFCK